MNAEMKRRWPLEPLAAGKRSLRRASKKRAVKTTTSGSLVLWIAYAIKCASGGHDVAAPAIPVFANMGTLGQENSAPMKRPHIFDKSSYP
jgi:hypothetical protein